MFDLLFWPGALPSAKLAFQGSNDNGSVFSEDIMSAGFKARELGAGQVNELRYPTAEVKVSFDVSEPSFPDAEGTASGPGGSDGDFVCKLALSAGYVRDSMELRRVEVGAHDRAFVVPAAVDGFLMGGHRSTGRRRGRRG